MSVADRSPRSRRRDFWQLDLPLVLVLILCVTLTVVEAHRATDGIWRAWVYLVEWPLIGAGAIWIWYHYRHGAGATGARSERRHLFAGMADGWRARVDEITREYDAEHAAGAAPAPGTTPQPRADAELDAWQAYVADVERRQPPGGPPT